MDLVQWIALVDSNEKLVHEVVDIYKWKYGNKTVVINDPRVEAKYLAIYYDKDERIFIQQLDTALKFLKTFGHLISSLRIEYSPNIHIPK